MCFRKKNKKKENKEAIKKEEQPVVSKKDEVKEKPVVKKEETVTNKPSEVKEKPTRSLKDATRTYHVVKRATDGKWEVKYAGGERAIKLFNTQKEAIEYSKKMAENQGGAMLVHNSKGANKGRIKKK